MGRAVVNTGSAGALVLDVNEVGYNVAGNYSDVSWALILDERVTSNSTWSGGGISATVGQHNIQEWWSGTFGFDWRPGGLQSQLIASGTNRVYHNADGSGSITVGANMGNTGTGGAGGPTQITNTIGLTRLTQVPGTPTNVSATRISDSQIRVNWKNQGASNGQATHNVIQKRVNGGSWDSGTVISASNTATVSAAANQRLEFRVAARNSAGTSSYSSVTSAVVTTPAAPTEATAAKQADQSIKISWTPQVDYSQHEHEVWHGVVSGGTTTWDSSALTTLASGTSTYTHTAPSSSQVHVYRVRAKAGSLYSGYATSNSVQLLVAPNKPTLAAMAAFANRAAALPVTWTHNSQDTTPQSAYEFSWSTDGGSTWSTSGKVVATGNSYTIPANRHTANQAVQMRVRTWGQATTGGSDGTGASPWSDVKTVTFKTAPTATITSPANGATLNSATVRVNLGFAQAEGATFVKAELKLNQTTGGTTLLEERDTTTLIGTTFSTQVDNATSYNVQARVQDSNGLWSAWVTNAFSVTYLPPVLPVATLTYLEEIGWGQLDLTVPDPGAGESAAAFVTITRRIGTGPEEVLVQDFPTSPELSFFDTTPTIHGSNVYTITVTTALGAQRVITRTLVTEECRRAFLSKGTDFSSVVVFGANLKVDIAVSVANATIQAAGRTKPIGLYGVETSKVLKVSSFVFPRESYSTLVELEAFLLVPGRTCFRDATGRRVFGTVKGSVEYAKVDRGDLKFNMTETS